MAAKSAHVPNRTPTPGAQRRRKTRDGAEQAKGHEGDGALGPGGLVGCQQPELHLHHVLDEEHLVLGEYLQDTRRVLFGNALLNVKLLHFLHLA